MKRKKIFAEWTQGYIDKLPDSSFAFIEKGEKDDEGKTTPRTKRHLPYKDEDGSVNMAHLKNALTQVEKANIPEDARADVRKTLEACMEKAKASESVIGIIPLEFSDNSESKKDGDGAAIPAVIHLIPVGQWEHPCYGPILITSSDIHEFALNFANGVRKGVFITAGHEGMSELPAVGWITEVFPRENGLWGKVDWNESGKELLADKAFKFFSPEFYQTYEDAETHQMFHNVLTGGALTKSPYFKELEAVIFSEPKPTNSPNSNIMFNLEELLAKKIEDLTKEEQAFIRENQAKLTEEQKTALTAVLDAPETPEEKEAREKKEAEDKAAADKKAQEDANVAAGLNPDGSAKAADPQVNASEKVMISASELKVLRDKADEGARAFAELNRQKIDASVTALVFSDSNSKGKFLPKQKDALKAFMETLNDSQRAKFSELVNAIPSKISMSEIGSGDAAVAGTAKAEVDAKIATKQKENPKMGFSEALRAVMAENPGLEERYDRELVPVRGTR